MKKTARTVEQYLDSLDESVQPDMRTLHEKLSKHMPGVTPKLWEGAFWGGSQQAIIGYGDMTVTRSDKTPVEWFMVGLALQKNYISVYNCAVEDGKYVVKKYGDRLGKAKIGSSSISFKQLSDINMDELLRLTDLASKQLKEQYA